MPSRQLQFELFYITDDLVWAVADAGVAGGPQLEAADFHVGEVAEVVAAE